MKNKRQTYVGLFDPESKSQGVLDFFSLHLIYHLMTNSKLSNQKLVIKYPNGGMESFTSDSFKQSFKKRKRFTKRYKPLNDEIKMWRLTGKYQSDYIAVSNKTFDENITTKCSSDKSLKYIESLDKSALKEKMGIFPKILIGLLIIALAVSGYFLYLRIDESNEQLALDKKDLQFVELIPSTDLEPIPDADSDVPPPEPESNLDIDWDALRATNPDIVAWIQFDNPAIINYPVMQSTNNQHYLHTRWNGGWSRAGAIFMNTHNEPDLSDFNTTIYGHKMRNGSMFGSLHAYRSQAHADKYPWFRIYLPTGEIYHVHVFSASLISDGGPEYYTNLDTDAEKQAYIKNSIARSEITPRVNVTSNDRLVSLSTCSTNLRRLYLQGVIHSRSWQRGMEPPPTPIPTPTPEITPEPTVTEAPESEITE